jgi:alginate O-acetyltransferase complex protein AlgI
MLRDKQSRRFPRLVLFISHITTMVVIGLWHGISWNFAIWGAWHGVGLFIHKVWSDHTAKWYRSLDEKPRLKQIWSAAGVFLTFHYVLFGWVWFALPDPAYSIQTFRNLLGV